MSTFSGLTNALRSLNAQQYALSITSQNMANANTVGYTRKTADFNDVGTVGGVPRITSVDDSYAGTVSANTASRQNDLVLDYRNRVEQGLNSYAQTKKSTLAGVETVFNEPSDTGLAEQLNGFWNSMSNLANANGTGTSTSNATLRSNVLQAAAKVTANLNAASTELSNLTVGATSDLNQTVSAVNAAATNVALLNQQIKVGTASGEDVSTLMDQRDSALLTLAKLAGATSTPQADGSVTVSLPPVSPSVTPVTLVAGNVASTMAVSGASPTVSITVGGTAVGSSSGQLQGDVDTLNTILPGYAANLDGIASSLATAVNTQQQAGYDANGNAATSTPFFSGSTAATIGVAITNGALIAASGVATPVTVPVTPPNSDTSNAALMAALGTASGGADDQYSSMIGSIAMASQQATQAATVQSSVATNVSNLQQSASGVNYDEETTNILVYQRAYQASSRVLTTVDEMLDQLINHTGRAGL